MARSDEGLKSDALKAALDEAIRGNAKKLEALLERHGALPSPRPNLKLAAAFGTELSTLSGELVPLLARLAADDSPVTESRVFLPVAAAHGFIGRIRAGREVERAWRHLLELAADERAPVRVGTLDALVGFGAREGNADELVRRGTEWLEEEDRDLKFGAAALMLEALTASNVASTVRDAEALFAYISAVNDAVADAPRAAERLDSRRRVLVSLPRVIATALTQVARGEAGLDFFRAESDRAKHPDVRAALSDALQRLRDVPSGPGAHVVDSLTADMQGSAKPLRYEALVRPGTGRGRRSRKTR